MGIRSIHSIHSIRSLRRDAALLCALAMAAAPAAAVTYPVDLDQQLRGLRIIATTHAADANGDVMILTLTNLDQRPARCKATFDIRVLAPKTYQRNLATGEEIHIHHRVRRTPNRMNIELVCRPGK